MCYVISMENKFTDLVTEGYSSREMAKLLGMSRGSVRYYLNKYGLTTKKVRKWTDEQFKEAVESEESIAGVLRRLNLTPAGSNYGLAHRYIESLGLDTSHFTGQAHLKGKNNDWSVATPLIEILVENSTYTNTSYLKHRLVRGGLLRYACGICGISEWLGQRLALPMDHINGVRTDNRLENLRLLCSNCHSQTPTFAGRNKKISSNGGIGIRATPRR